LPSPETKARILHEGLNLMGTAGPCGVTFGTIARRARMSKSGILAHFDSMTGLKIGILEKATRLWRNICLDSNADVLVGLPGLAHYLNRWIGWTAWASLLGACPIASAIFELDYLPGAVREVVTTVESIWRSTLVQLVDSSISNRDLVKTTDSHQIAWDLFGTYLTHHVSMHFLRDPEADRKAALP
jgi:AcrR family transcriptional regulator